MRRTDRELVGCSLRQRRDASPHIAFRAPLAAPFETITRPRKPTACVQARGSAREDDALAGQDLPAVVLVLDLLDTAEVRHVLAQNHLDHAGVSLENSNSFISAAHPPAGEDLTSRSRP